MTSPGLAAWYFDGQSSRRHLVKLVIEAGLLRITGDVTHDFVLGAAEFSERVRHGGRRIRLPGNASIEVLDVAALNAALRRSGYKDSWVIRLQQSWRGTLVALGSTVVLLVMAYLQGVPLLAQWMADRLPVAAERVLGARALDVLDAHGFTLSLLPGDQQDRIRRRFASLNGVSAAQSPVRLVFRHSLAGANAFALPSGDIVVTDALVSLIGETDGLQGVLAHELGHLQARHLLRRMMQASLVAGGVTLLAGDVTGVLAAAPAVLLNLKYSRDAEREADDFAVHWLRLRGLSLRAFADALAQLGQTNEAGVSVYLSTHPDTDERIARVRQVPI